MKIKCINCQKQEYEFSLSEMDKKQPLYLKFTCPQCGETTVVYIDDGGVSTQVYLA